MIQYSGISRSVLVELGGPRLVLAESKQPRSRAGVRVEERDEAKPERWTHGWQTLSWQVIWRRSEEDGGLGLELESAGDSKRGN